YPGIEFDRTLVLTGEYALDLTSLRASDGKTHRFDWFYHNFGTASSNLSLKPYTALPQTGGYQHLTNDAAVETNGPWSMTFSQPDSKLNLFMLESQGTAIGLGQGLGPDLRVPVPFVAAPREASETSYAAVYEPYVKSPALISFRQSAAGNFIVQMPSFTDDL